MCVTMGPRDKASQEVLTKRKEKLEAALNQVQSKSNMGWNYFQMLL